MMILVFPVPRSPITRILYKCSCLPGAAYSNVGRGERRRRGGGEEGEMVEGREGGGG